MSKPKMLYILNIASRVNSFSHASMLAAQKLGIEFHIAGNWGYQNESERMMDEEKYGINIHQIDFIRTPYHPGNYKAYKQLCKLVETEKYDVIHCNTPIGGLLGRLVGRKYKVNKVIYQAHGFHFFKGAPKLNWLIYYPIERWLAHMTDALITINQEDYERAMKFRLRKGGKVYYVPGVGIDTDYCLINEKAKENKRLELNLNLSDIVLISMGDLIKRKNYAIAIKAIAKLKDCKFQYFICGTGPEENNLKKLVKQLGIESKVHFLGFRTDVAELLQIADIFLLSTKQEGLPRSLMEAMACGVPCVVSDIRGNVDLICDGKGGYIFELDNVDDLVNKINSLVSDDELRIKFGNDNMMTIKSFSVDFVQNEILKIYGGISV